MRSHERVTAAIEHRKTEKVPKGELGIAPELSRELLGVDEIGLTQEIDVRRKLSIDLINWWCAKTVSTPIEIDKAGNEIYKDAWGSIWRKSKASSEIIETSVKEIDDIRHLSYPPHSMYEKNTDTLTYFKNQSDLFVFGQTEGVFTPLSWLLGFDDFMIYTCTQKDKIEKFAMQLAEYYAELGKMIIDSGAHGILIGDDIAFNGGTFISPDALREIIFPALKREVKIIKGYKDIPVFMHTDGNINSVLDDIVDCGFDGLHSLQPTAGMDLAYVKEKYGRKLCLMGNIDINHILPFGTEDEIRKNVKGIIAAGSKDSGYILSTCNILTRDIPAKNAFAMYDEAEKYLAGDEDK